MLARMRNRFAIAILCLYACGGGSSTDQTLTVRIQGAGSVAGAVHSEPAGLDCVLVENAGGSNEIECTEALPAGEITLVFEPSGAAVTAQFNIDGEPCNDQPTSDTCKFDLLGDIVVDVFPISAPPP